MSEPNSGPPTEPPLDSAVAVLVAQEAQSYDTIHDNLITAVLALWASFSAYWAGDSVVDIAQRISRLVIAGQRNVGRLTEAHLRQQFRRMGLELPRGTIVDLPPDLRLGADAPEVYQRPVRQVRYLDSVGTLLDDAVEQATDRLVKQIESDLQLARAEASKQLYFVTNPKQITGWRRIIHPELGNVCGLCIAASDRIYQRIQRMDLHPGCKCTTLPITTEDDPGRKLNAEDLSRIYAAAGGTTESRALAQVRVEVKRNGELGDILVPEGVKMKGPGQVKRQLSDRAAELRRKQLQRQIDDLQARESLSGWHQDRLEQLEELLASA
jgi:hypothetical protein